MYSYKYTYISEEIFFKTQSTNYALTLQAHFYFGMLLIPFWKRALHIYQRTCLPAALRCHYEHWVILHSFPHICVLIARQKHHDLPIYIVVCYIYVYHRTCLPSLKCHYEHCVILHSLPHIYMPSLLDRSTLIYLYIYIYRSIYIYIECTVYMYIYIYIYI